MGNAGTKRLEHHVSLLRQSLHLPAPIGGFQIHNDTFLTPVPGQPRRMAAERVAGSRFDLDNVSAEVGQDCRGESTRHAPTEIQNAKSIARSGHLLLLRKRLSANKY